MNFIQRPQINCEKWDLLVASTENSSIYNYSFFLDSVCENWCILVDEEYSKGIAIPFTNKLNYKIVYTPNFLRTVDFLGDINHDTGLELINKIKNEFHVGSLSIANSDFIIEGESRTHQEIKYLDSRLNNSLAKRMLKKFEHSQLYITTNVDLDNIFSFLESHLFQRIKSLTNIDFIRFKKLIYKLNDLQLLKKYGVFDSQGELKGCALFLQTDKKLIYLKGVACSEEMKEGAMYAILNHSINMAKEDNLVFDFGGSNIDSIKQFYTNLGGKDMIYYRIKWGKEPIYYQIAKYIYHYFIKLK
jgi:hypothetical protein